MRAKGLVMKGLAVGSGLNRSGCSGDECDQSGPIELAMDGS